MAIKYTQFISSNDQIKQIKKLITDESDHMFQLAIKELKEIIKRKESVIALNNDEVVGFIRFFSHGKEYDTQTEVLECGSIVVSKLMRGKGIGKNLVKELIRMIKSRYEKIMLVAVVKRTNPVSYNFLKKIGAKDINKPKCLALYTSGGKEENFYILDLTDVV